VIRGFSKSAGMTGGRLGYASGPRAVIDSRATFQQYSYVCANSMAQKAAVKAVDHDMKAPIERYSRRLRLVYEGLKDQFTMARLGEAFYLFPEAPGGDADTL